MKYLLKRNGDKGLFLFTENDRKFVVGTIEDDNGLGNSVNCWWQGHYFTNIDDAIKELMKKHE